MPNTTFPASATGLSSITPSALAVADTPASTSTPSAERQGTTPRRTPTAQAERTPTAQAERTPSAPSMADPLSTFLLRDLKPLRSTFPEPTPRDPDSHIVLFRKDIGENGLPRITAVFPCDPAMDGQMLGFTREEGPMTCSRLWFDLSRPATAAEYEGLAVYLTAKGDHLDIRHRITPAMDATRARNFELETLAATLADAEEEARAEELGQKDPLAVAREACLSAARIVASVTGVSVDLAAPPPEGAQPLGEVVPASPARWTAMFLAVTAFEIAPALVAKVFGRGLGGVERAVRRVEDARDGNGMLGAMVRRMERLAREEERRLEAA